MSLGNAAASNQGANDGEDEVDAILRHSEKRFHEAHLGILDALRELVNPTRRAVEEEALFNGELQSSRFLYEGNKACKFVGKIFLQNGNQGTGTLLSERVLLTAAHIFNNCKEGEVSFERVDPDRSFYQMSEVKFALEPDTFFLKHPDKGLDIALIAVSERSLDGETPIREMGFCKKVLPSIAPGTHVNIIQYPENGNQMVVLRQNHVLHYDESFLKLFSKDFVEHHRYETRRCAVKKNSWKLPFKRARENVASSDTSSPFLHYRADTKHGSSGAPCFDDQWNLIGFHHCALLVEHKKKPNMFTYEANEGVRINVVFEWAEKVELDGFDL
ncbi:uncharacterized protein LOC111340559 [Stylophora pistillata]|uniref:Uncharacterized protein y4fB n=1 Tax=Stylophora pistillata TaxID=50429 RepID=A0A2B4SYJ4_STYPI|nr:uncharacterized protein LOC111340559 [Stylophora pistillata]PFX34981.1 Uncharacterized protein y4fB [Stylophora pistillata]